MWKWAVTLIISLLWKNMAGLKWQDRGCSSLNVIFVFLLNHSNETIIHCRKVLVPVSENWVWGSWLHLTGEIWLLENVTEVRFHSHTKEARDHKHPALSGLLRSDSRMQHFLVNREELLYARSLLRWRYPSSRKPKVCTAISFGFRLCTLVVSGIS